MTQRMSPIEFARLRRQMADEFERLMWQLLRNRQRKNHKFRREHSIGIYTLDFYCPAAKLAIEVDGISHQTEEAKQYDAARDDWLEAQGIRVLRFACSQVSNETQKILNQIDQALVESPSPPTPLPTNSD